MINPVVLVQLLPLPSTSKPTRGLFNQYPLVLPEAILDQLTARGPTDIPARPAMKSLPPVISRHEYLVLYVGDALQLSNRPQIMMHALTSVGKSLQCMMGKVTKSRAVTQSIQYQPRGSVHTCVCTCVCMLMFPGSDKCEYVFI